jgi:hypothetical protein
MTAREQIVHLGNEQSAHRGPRLRNRLFIDGASTHDFPRIRLPIVTARPLQHRHAQGGDRTP